MSAIELLRRFNRPSSTTSSHDVSRMAKVAEVGKRFLRIAVESFIGRRRHQPIMIWYASDSTPLSTREMHRRSWECYRVRRSGRRSNDLLMQRLFVQDCAGDAAILFTEPLALEDKSTWSHYEAFRRLLPTGRELGHEALLVSFHCFDRALESSMDRRIRQLRESLRQRDLAARPEGQAHLRHLLSWHLSVGCILHDTHNSLRWGVFDYSSNKDCMRAFFITLESLRNSYDLLMAQLPRWLPKVLAFEEWGFADPSPLWVLLGVSSEIVELLSQMQLRFQGGQLKVAPSFQAKDDLPDLIAMCLMHIWTFRRFSESRWLTLGSSSRCLIASLLLGLPSLVGDIMASSSSRYYISGFQHLDASVKEVASIIATSSFISDSVMAQLLDDDRVVHRIEILEGEVYEELAYTSAIDMNVFEVIGEAVGWTGARLRHEAVASALTQGGFIMSRLRVARRLPWSLAIGDLQHNLDSLSSGPPPAEETAAKVFGLLGLGYNRQALAEGLRLMSQCSWSTNCVEQGHSAASGLMKQHRQLSLSTLKARAMCRLLHPLLIGGDFGRREQRLERRVAALDRKQPSHITGRQMFLREMNALGRARQAAGRAVGDAMSKRLFMKHGKQWARLSLVHRARFEEMAVVERERRAEELQGLKDSAQASRDLNRKRSLEASSPGMSPLLVSSCAFTPAQKVEFESLFASDDFSTKKVDALRAAADQPCGRPTESCQSMLEAMQVHCGPERSGPPPWLALICRHRHVFQKSILKFISGEHCRLVLFVYATQSPMFACFCELEEIEVPGPQQTPASWEQATLETWEHNFCLQWDILSYSDDEFYQASFDIKVLLGIVHVGGGRVCADSAWQALGEVERLIGNTTSGALEPDKSEKPAATPESEPWAQHPWLLELMAEQNQMPPGVDTTKPGSSSESESDCEGDIGDTGIFDELMQRRWELGSVAPQAESFVWALRGGAWTAANRGVSYDCFSASAKRGVPQDFCQRYSLPKSSSYAISLYGEEAALGLAKAWVSRMEFLIGIWFDHGAAPAFEFSHVHLARYSEPADLGELCRTSGGRAEQRLEGIRAIAPGRPAP